jgi:hypothetical protein
MIFGHLGLVLPLLVFLLIRAERGFNFLGRLRALDLSIVAVAQISVQVMNSFAGGPSIETWILTIPIGLILVYSLIEEWKPQISQQMLIGFVAIWLVCLVQVGRETPYEWSGISSSPLTASRSKPDIKHLELFRIESYNSMKIELLSREIKNLGLENTPVLYGLRNAGMARLFGTESYSLHCPVLWWDVCPESIAVKDEAQIKENPPKAVVWLFETQEMITGNEAAWRAGSSSAAGRIQTSLQEDINRGVYEIVCEFNESPLNPGPVTRLLVRSG